MRTEDTAPVDFPVWDVRSPLPPHKPYVSSMLDGDTCTGLMLCRGGPLGREPALGTFSMRPALAANDPAFLARTALLAFAAGLDLADPGGFVDEMNRMSLAGGESTYLLVDGEHVPATAYTPWRECWVIRATDPRFGVAVAGSQVDAPEVTSADWSVWAERS